METEKYKQSANEILNRLLYSMKSPEGYVHPQSLLCCIGSLAGYSCQEDVRRIYTEDKGLSEEDVFTVFTDKSGNKYFYGDMIDSLLTGNDHSIWSFTGGVLYKLGEPFTDVGEILRYTAATAGSEKFGKIRNCITGETVQSYIKLLWQPLLNVADSSAERGELHGVYGLCIQKALMTCKDAVAVTEGARIVMESALTGARINFRDI